MFTSTLEDSTTCESSASLFFVAAKACSVSSTRCLAASRSFRCFFSRQRKKPLRTVSFWPQVTVRDPQAQVPSPTSIFLLSPRPKIQDWLSRLSTNLTGFVICRSVISDDWQMWHQNTWLSSLSLQPSHCTIGSVCVLKQQKLNILYGGKELVQQCLNYHGMRASERSKNDALIDDFCDKLQDNHYMMVSAIAFPHWRSFDSGLESQET